MTSALGIDKDFIGWGGVGLECKTLAQYESNIPARPYCKLYIVHTSSPFVIREYVRILECGRLLFRLLGCYRNSYNGY